MMGERTSIPFPNRKTIVPGLRGTSKSISATEFVMAARQAITNRGPVSSSTPIAATLSEQEKRKHVLSPSDLLTPHGNNPKAFKMHLSPDGELTFRLNPGFIEPNDNARRELRYDDGGNVSMAKTGRIP